MLRRFFLATLPLLLLAGCNAYHPLRGGIGYTDLPIGPKSFDVTYSGPYDMPLSEARRYCLYRAAEVTVLHHDPYFQILGEQAYFEYGTAYYPGNYESFYYGWGRRGYWGYAYEPGYVQPYTLPQVAMRIQLEQNPGPQTIPAAYLINEAHARGLKLDPEVVTRAQQMPSAPAYIPPPPPLTRKPAPTTSPSAR